MNTETCPQCGKPLATDALMGLCPECLVRSGFATLTGDTNETRPFEPPTPEELGARFPELEILALLGRGGMGAVYQARQKRLDRVVALKILPPRVDQDPSFAARFEREARALAKLHHPHIVSLHEFGEADGLFYFIMEYVDGVNLRQLLNAGRIAPSEALAIVPQICEALQFAHDRGIVHRDIKPENILLNQAGQVKIADFGVAKMVAGEWHSTDTPLAAEGQTEAGKIIGTPSYMAPEQMSHPQDVDNRADIYALGVVFYQMLTGELPNGKIEPPSRKVQIDVRLDEIVLRALEQNPELRYQEISVFKTQVETIAATPETAPPSAADESGRSPSPLHQQIWANMDAGEKREMTMRNVMFAIWNSATWFAPILIIFTTHGGARWLYAALTLALGLAGNPVWRKILREGLSSTKWAQENRVTAARLKESFKASQPPRWTYVVGGMVFVGAMFFFDFGIEPHTHWSKPVSVTMGFLTVFSLTTLCSFLVDRFRKGARTGNTASRFSRTAIFGACWPFLVFVILVLLASPLTGLETDPAIKLSIILSVIGTTNFGWIAVSQIRNSAGRLHGMWLAVVDGLLPPLLTLDTYVGIALHRRDSIETLANALVGQVDVTLYVATYNALVLLTLAIVIGANVLIARKVWCALNPRTISTQPDVKPLAYMALFFGVLSNLIPMIFYWNARAIPWITPQFQEAMLGLTLVLAALAIILGSLSRASRAGWTALVLGGISMVIWMLCFIGGLVSENGTASNQREPASRSWIVDDIARKLATRDELIAKITEGEPRASASLSAHLHELAQFTPATLSELSQRESARNQALGVWADVGTLQELHLQQSGELFIQNDMIRHDLRTFGERFLPAKKQAEQDVQLTVLAGKTTAALTQVERNDNVSREHLNSTTNDFIELLASWQDVPQRDAKVQKLVAIFADEERKRAEISEQHRQAATTQSALGQLEKEYLHP
ncbi:MAG: bifunctional serine/threonine protein kinase/MFS transporter [Chthoniobacterales bacterium]